MQKKMGKEKDNINFSKFVITMYVLKVKFDFSKKISGFLIFISNLQPLFLILELHTKILNQQTTLEQKNVKPAYFYEIIRILFRPSLKLISISGEYVQYTFFMVIFLILTHKACLVIFTLYYFKIEHQQILSKKTRDSFFLKLCGYSLNFYQQLAGSYLFQEMSYLCLLCFLKQLEQLEHIGFLLVTLNIITILLLIVDSIGSIIINECTITNKVFGLEKLVITIYRYIYHLLIFIQLIIAIEFDYIYIEYIISAISLCQQLVLLIDLFIHFNYILHYQQYPLILAISINLSFSLSLFIASIQNLRLLTFLFLIIFSLVLVILVNMNQKIENAIMLELFRQKKNNFNYLRFGLIKMLNNEIYFEQQDLMIKILIAKWHSLKCQSKICTFCNHVSIQNPEQSCCITNQMYEQFVLQILSCFFERSQIYKKRSNQNKYLIIYAYFLFDFGWILRSVKILNSFIVDGMPCQEEYQSMQSQNNLNRQSYEDDLKLKDTYFFQNDLQKRNSFLNFDYLSRIKIQYLIQCGKFSISSSLIGSSLEAQQQSITQEYIETQLKSDIRIRFFESKIVEVLILKQQLYKDLKNTSIQYQHDINFNKQLYQLCKKLYEVDKLLKYRFFNTPTQKIHCLYTFFLGEILNNYNKSIKFYKNQRVFEIDSNKFQQILNFNNNSQNFDYVILELCDDMENLILKGQSQNFYDNYGLNTEKQRLFEHLLPDCFIPYHNVFVKQFLEKGTSRYFNIFGLNFIMNNQHLLTIVNMCHRVTDLLNANNVTFAVFLQQATLDQAFLIIDGNNMKCTFTKNLLILLGWTEQQINQYCILKEFKQIEISQIYPNFSDNLMQFSEDEIKLRQVNLYFPSPQSSFESLQREIRISNIKFKKIECDILIKKKQISNYCYYILDIIKMAEFKRGRQFSQIFQNSIKQNEQLNQSLYQDCIVDQEDDSPHIGNLNSVNFLNQQQFGSIQNISKPKFFQSDPIIKGNYSQVLNSRREETMNQSEQLLITQRNSQIKQAILSPGSQNQKSVQSNDEQEQSSKKLIGLKLDENSIETDKMHKNNELLQQILSKSPSRYQQQFMYLFSVWFLLFIIFIIVQYIELINDLDDFLSYGFMTSFYASIMGPHDLFFSMRITITAYQQMNREGFLPQNKLLQLIQPFQDNVQLGYSELRDNLYDQLNSQYIQSFLDDVNVTMYFMNKNDQEIYGLDISFRDGLLIFLQYQYAQMIHLNHRISTSGMPYQISLFANYFMLHKESENLTIQMYDFAIQMHQNLNQKLLILWVVFNFAFIIMYIYLQLYQFHFFQQLDKFIKLIFLIDQQSLNNEIEKINDLLVSMKSNSNIFFIYNPENQLQQLLIKSKHFQKHQNQNQIQKQNYQSINKTRNIIKIINSTFIIFLLLIILIFSLLNIISTTIFFNKYDDTLQLYQQIQEMKLRPGNLFLYREIFLRWQNFTFLTENNKLQLYDLVDKAQNAISNYIQLSNTINVDTYLIDQNFKDFFENLNLHTVCEQIDEKFKNLTSPYCGLAFEGSLTKGMITALSYISNLVKSQQAINNFTRRVEIQYYEQEGSQIVSRIFSVLVNQFNFSLKRQFDDMKLYLTVLSISFIIITVVIQMLIYFYYSTYLGRIMKIIKKVIHLIPFESLMNNEMIERQLKELNFNFQ